MAASLAIGALAPADRALAQDDPARPEVPDDLTQLTFEELLEVRVTSVSRQPEPLGEAPAAIFVITGDQIVDSGAKSLTEALRMVPGLNVARINPHTWGVSSRGFNGSLSDKLEVLMDGRSLYSPLFSGVFWEAQDALLEDIDRIEVVRGPGGTLWGANAVNGVINIVTKSAAESRGTLVSLSVGNERKWYGAARAGGKLGERSHLRAYAKSWELDGGATPDGGDAEDGLRIGFTGFRSDWESRRGDAFTLQGDLYDGTEQDPFGETELDGGNMLFRWVRTSEGLDELVLQAYNDRYRRETPLIFGEDRDTWDLQLQGAPASGGRHKVVWGAGYRRSADRTARDVLIIFSPPDRTLETVNVFVQDQIALNEKLTFTIGTKVEHTDLTGIEVQPGMRIGWSPRRGQTFWASLARAVRIPNRIDHDLALDIPVGTEGFPDGGILEIGNRDFQSEALIALEAGYRVAPSSNLWLDLAAFYNDYERLRGLENPFPSVFVIGNSLEGEGYGFEAVASWRPAQGWFLQSGFSTLSLDLQPVPGSTDIGTDVIEGNDPDYSGFLRASFTSGSWQFHGALRHVAELVNQEVPAYTELDLRLAVRINYVVELALIGQDLLHDQHPEFRDGASEVERSFVLQTTLRFDR